MRALKPALALPALAAALMLATLAACGKKVEDKPQGSSGSGGASGGSATGTGGGAPDKSAAARAPGVDPDKKIITLGGLYDQSGPAKQIGVAFVNGKRLLAKAVAAGAVKLPDGWKIEILEKDHGYNPQQSVQLYKEIRDQVLLVTTSFGTAATLPLVEDLKRDDMIAFPASLSSAMAKNEHTPPVGPPYTMEAMRAMDWAVESAGGADKVKAGIIYQRDDYGEDGLAGWKQAAAHHKVAIVAEQTVKPGDQDFTAVVKALKDAGATHVLLTTLPSAVPGILGTAAKLKYAPAWIGNSPSWVDVFFTKLPAPLLANFHWVTGLIYWGEDVPGMKDFLEVWKAHGADMGEPDFYILVSYVHGLVQLEVLRRAIEAKQIDRAGVKRALHSITNWEAGGLTQPVDLSKVPYVTSTRTRILAPDIEKKSWKPVAGWAEPKAAAAAKP
jgi:ABC-type branched-subunit amino acid transport system substrate-binding protein